MDRADRNDRDPTDQEGPGTTDYVGDSPGEPFEIPDDPVAADQPGTTAQEQRERSLERRLAMDEPEEVGEQSSEPAESAEESAMHIERE